MNKDTAGEMGNKNSVYERMRVDKAKIAAALGMAAVTAAALVGVGGESRSVAPSETVAAPTFEESLAYDLAATEKVLIGGFNDPSSRGVLDYLSNQGMINHSERNVLVTYPADLARGEESAAIGSQSAKNAYYDNHNRGNHTVMVGFSQGTIPLARAATEIANENGGRLPDDVTIVAYGGPAGENGLWESPFGQVAEPFINFATPTHDRLPAGSYDVASANDPYASSGQDTWLGQIAKFTAVNQAHRIPRADEPRMAWTGSDGVHYERTDVGVHPWTMVINSQGTYVNEGFNAFFNNIVPVSNGRDAAPSANSMQAFRGLGRGIDIEMKSGVPVFETLFSVLPHPLIQVGLDLATKGPDVLVKGAAFGVQGVTKGPDAAFDVFNEPVPMGVEKPDPLQQTANGLHDTVERYVGQVIPGAKLPELNLPSLTEVFSPGPAAEVPRSANPVQQAVEQVQRFIPPAAAPVFRAPAPAPAPARAPAPIPAPIINLPPPPPPVQNVINQVNDFVGGFIPR